ncbi:MAG: TolC family protein [Bacteroides sp.]|nr:TolC family protein [Bacteroides sp.]MCM1084763.1 TolC family protein [Bacteroides sp.]
MKALIVFAIATLYSAGFLYAQDVHTASTRQMSLAEVLSLSNASAEAKIARYTFLSSHWEYESVRKNILPTLSFSGTLPQINRSFTKATLPDGREAFVSQFYGDYSGGLELQQVIPQTNTKISVSSGLERLDLYGQEHTKSYLATPFKVGVSQSLFTYNADKWERKINPVKYNAAKQRYLQEREAVYAKAAALYFDLLSAQEQYKNAKNIRAYSDTLYAMASEKYRKQSIVESEYLQVELNALQAEYEERNCYRLWKEALFTLKDFLSVEDSEEWILTMPDQERLPLVSQELALNEASENNSVYHEFKQKEIEAHSNLIRSKTANRFSMDIYASFSLNQNAGALAKSYTDLLDQEMVSVGLRIPILDWGRSKSQIKMAQAQKDVTLLQIDQERRTFVRELISLVEELGVQEQKVLLSRRAIDIANRKLSIETLMYRLAKVDFSHYQDALIDQKSCLITYLEDQKQYWLLYYSVRKTTLYDFMESQKIETSFKDLLLGDVVSR